MIVLSYCCWLGVSKVILSTCGAETLLQSSPMFGDLSLCSDQISGQNKKSLNTFVSGMKDSHLSVGHCGQKPVPLYIRPIYLPELQTSAFQTTQNSHRLNKCGSRLVLALQLFCSQCAAWYYFDTAMTIDKVNLIWYLKNYSNNLESD